MAHARWTTQRVFSRVPPLQAFVFCCAHANEIEAYLLEAGWLAMNSFKVHTVSSRDCTSAGDALRFIDQRNCIRGDFILISGDVVSNLHLTEALALHRERRKKDKQAIMTIMTKKLSCAAKKRLGDTDLVMGVDPNSKQLVAYEEGSQKSAHMRIESKYFKGRKVVQVRGHNSPFRGRGSSNAGGAARARIRQQQQQHRRAPPT